MIQKVPIFPRCRRRWYGCTCLGQRRLLGKQREELATEPELQKHLELALVLVGRDELENEWVVHRREDVLVEHVRLLLGGDDLLLAHAST